MDIRKMIAGTALTAGLVVGMSFATSASPVQTPLGSSSGAAGGDITFTGTPGGTLTETSTVGSYTDILGGGITFPVTISLTTSGPGSYTFTSGTGAFDQAFTSGTFSVKSGSTLLLGGTFGASDLTGINGGPAGGLALSSTSVTYDPTSTKLDGLLTTNGSLSLEFTGVKTGSTGGFVANAGGLSAFTATDDITYSGVMPSVPEPTTVASFSLGGFGLLGLMLRARKARRTA